MNNMIIGIPKEIKNNENRIAISPAGVNSLVKNGHIVLIETEAGTGSGFTDNSFRAVGAEIMSNPKAVWEKSDMIIKVKEPLPEEFGYFREGLILFTYLHLASAPELTVALMESKVTAIAYETIQLEDGSLPLLAPMSEVAGRMSVQLGAHILEKTHGGRGILLGGVSGVQPAHTVIIGGGVVGTCAAEMAVGLRSRVTILDNSPKRLKQLDELFQGRTQNIMSNDFNIENAVISADLLIGAVLIPGAKAPKIVKEEYVKQMRAGAAIVDVAIDQGGCIETIDRVTTHDQPTYIKYGVVHYGVANIPGAVPYTSTIALTNVTLPYILDLANKDLDMAFAQNPALAKGINVQDGRIMDKAVAESFPELTPSQH